MEKILEILKKHIKNKLFDEPLTDDDPKYLARKRIMKVDGYEDAAKEIHELYYPEEFVIWFSKANLITMIIDDVAYYCPEVDQSTTEPDKKYTLNELCYNYWLTEIKGGE